MLHLMLEVSSQQNQVDALAAQYQAAAIDGEWVFQNELDLGALCHYPLSLDLAVYTYEYELSQPLRFNTINPADSRLSSVGVARYGRGHVQDVCAALQGLVPVSVTG